MRIEIDDSHVHLHISRGTDAYEAARLLHEVADVLRQDAVADVLVQLGHTVYVHGQQVTLT